SSRTTADASSTAFPPRSTRCPRSPTPSPDGSRSTSTAASGAARTSPRPWRSERTPCSPAARRSSGSLLRARKASGTSSRSCGTSSRSRCASSAAGRPRSSRARTSNDARRSWQTPATVYALNFYSPLVADQLRSGRKSATIRLGDKSGKYKKGMVVRVLCGVRFSPREHVFDAVIDKVEVKTLGELSPREIEHDNPEIRRTDEMANFLGQLYNREVGPDDLITVIRFSQIMGGPVVPAFEGDLF